jgi:hypothetical protein
MCNCKWTFTSQFQIQVVNGQVYILCLKHNDQRGVSGVSLKYDNVEQGDIDYSYSSVIKTI